MKIQSSVLKALGAALALIALVVAPSGSSAQAPDCAGTVVPSSFGRGCASRVEVPAITNDDYAVIRVQFNPPPRADDVISANDLRGTWLAGLLARTQGSVRSATVLLDILAVNRGETTGVTVATVPLAVYEYDGTRNLRFRETRQFGNRILGPRLLIRNTQTLQARVRIVFGHKEAGSLVDQLTTLARSAATLSGTQGGLIVHTIANPTALADLRAIEERIESVNEVQGESDDYINLSPAGENQLVYTFSLNPQVQRRGPVRTRPQARPQGNLIVSIERIPSILTQAAFDGPPGQRLPDYGAGATYTARSTTTVWQAPIAPGVTPDLIVQQGTIKTLYELFQSATTLADFERVCSGLQAELQRQSTFLSQLDQTALFWAAFARTPSATRPEFRDRSRCIKENLPDWEVLRLPLPTMEEEPPPTPGRAQVNRWIQTFAAPALAQADPSSQFEMLLEIFAPQVRVNIEANTIYDASEPARIGEDMSARELARDLKSMRVGCRFFQPGAEELSQFSILGRERATSNRLFTVTVDYRGRRGGTSPIEVVGLGIRPTTEADFALLRAQEPHRPHCHVPETAPLAPQAPTTPPQTPTTPTPAPATPPRQ